MNKEITIIVPVRNSVTTIKRCIDSIINQVNVKIECIVLDCLSDDGTSELLMGYGNKIKHIRENDYGIPDAMNKGIKLATSDLIGILDGDDYYYPSVIRKVVDIYQLDNSKVIACSMKIRGKNINYISTPLDISMLQYGMVINHTATFCPKLIFKNIGYYSLDFKYIADWDFYRKVHKDNYKFEILNLVTTEYSLGGATHLYSKVINQEIIKLLKQNKKKSNKENWILFKREYIYPFMGKFLTLISHKKNNYTYRMKKVCV